MNHRTSDTARRLTTCETFDLVRAGLILAFTVALALIVPPRVLGADPQQSDAAQAKSTK